MASVTLYHGTNEEAAREICASGRLLSDCAGRVYLTPSRDIAAEYGPAILSVTVPMSSVCPDYSSEPSEETDVREWLHAGRSVYVLGDVAL